jgi:NAD(P)-dependent dehydrogenase (short-subunit alcohol dehydrogenase family)
MSIPTIIVTGASRGLGAAAAQVAAELGANVVLTARSADELEEVAQSIRDAGRRAVVVAGDIGGRETAEAIVREAMAHFGRIDGVINNAGIVEPIAAVAVGDSAGWERNLMINLLAPMQLVQTALPYLRESEGRVINVSSGAAVNAVSGWAVYCAAKAGLNHFTRVLAKEEPVITALAVRPGIVDTEMQATIRREGERGMPAGDHQRFVGYHEGGELLPPERPGRALAALALFAPVAWSGEFLAWDEERVEALVPDGTAALG